MPAPPEFLARLIQVERGLEVLGRQLEAIRARLLSVEQAARFFRGAGGAGGGSPAPPAPNPCTAWSPGLPDVLKATSCYGTFDLVRVEADGNWQGCQLAGAGAGTPGAALHFALSCQGDQVWLTLDWFLDGTGAVVVGTCDLAPDDTAQGDTAKVVPTGPPFLASFEFAFGDGDEVPFGTNSQAVTVTVP